MSTNLSKIKRDKMLDLINELKEELKGDQDKLTALLDIENEIREKKYGLVWEEHEEAVDKELETKIPVFKEDKDREIKLGDEKVNFILEGDNLHSLYLLEKTHRGEIDVIYIDPPYNTGKNDFKYGDKMIGEDDGYRHSKWLSFMSKRLEIARELLTDEGVIFISIDDNEQANLKLLCDEIFGEKNFIENFMWLHGKGKKTKQSRTLQQYILCYAKNRHLLGEWYEESITDYKFSNIDNDPKGEWFSGSISFSESRSNKDHDNYYKITSPSGVEWERQWFVSKKEMMKLIDEGDIYWGKSPEFNNVPRKKIRPSIIRIIPNNIIEDKGTTRSAEKELENILGPDVFDYPKPVELIKHIIKISLKDSNIKILDFFAGSGTTGQAVLELNQEDGGNRTFILCTNNEVGEKKEKEFKKKYGDKEDYPEEWLEWEENYGIARSIIYERMRKVIEGYTTPKGKDVEGIPANLKYYKTDYIDKEVPEDDDYEVEEEILKYVVELIQLEYGIDISNKDIGLILSDLYGNLDEDYNVTKITKDRLDEIKVLYVAEGLLLPDNLEDELRERGIEIKWVPSYYNFN